MKFIILLFLLSFVSCSDKELEKRVKNLENQLCIHVNSEITHIQKGQLLFRTDIYNRLHEYKITEVVINNTTIFLVVHTQEGVTVNHGTYQETIKWLNELSFRTSDCKE